MTPLDSEELIQTLKSIDMTLKLLAGAKTHLPRQLVSRATIASALALSTTAIDKLIHEGIASSGERGLIEGVHYVKLDPRETNTARFRFDPEAVLRSAWHSFSRPE